MLKENYSLLAHNTFGIDVCTDYFFEYKSEDELCQFLVHHGLANPYLHIGAGSNLLFTNSYHGWVLHSAIKGIEVIQDEADSVVVRVGAGVVWDDFVAYCVAQNWYGAENLSLIPGEVGASAVQNIGAYGAEAKDLIVAVEAINVKGEKRIFSADECNYAYRKSIFKQPDMKEWFVTYVHYRLSKLEEYALDYGTIREELKAYDMISLATVREVVIKIRNSKLPDPQVQGNAGSFFMNPVVEHSCYDALAVNYPKMPHYELPNGKVKIPAGWLIDQCGWKGKGIGPAAVHDKQALVLVNRGGATGNDVITLAEAIQKSVSDKFGIQIYPEVNFI